MSRTHGMTEGARRALRRVRIFGAVLLIAMGALFWRTFTESDRVQAEVDRRICKLAERTYLPPASTADGKRRQAANRQFAKAILGCTPPDERR